MQLIGLVKASLSANNHISAAGLFHSDMYTSVIGILGTFIMITLLKCKEISSMASS